MPVKRKYDNVATRRISSWLRSVKARSTSRRAPVRRFTSRSRLRKRSGRRAGRRGQRSGRRYKGSSSFQRLTRILAPVSSYSFQVAGRATVLTGDPVGVTGYVPCEWFLPQRALNFSLGYPNQLDVSSVATALNDLTKNQALVSSSGATDRFTHSIDSLDFKFVTRDYVQSTKMVNQSNAQAVIQYHVLESRRDIPLYTGGADSEASYDLLNLFGQGLYVTAVASALNTGNNTTAPSVTGGAYGGNSSITDAAFSVFNTGPFLHYFKVKTVTKHIMNAGDVKMFTLTNKRAITNHPALYNQLTTGDGSWKYAQHRPQYAFLKGTQFQFFKLVGTPFNSAANKDLVNSTQPAVDYITTCSFKYQAVMKSGKVNYRAANYNLGGFLDGQFMGEQQETPLTALNA